MDKYTGKKLDGRYEIRELIGVGGMVVLVGGGRLALGRRAEAGFILFFK